MKNLLIDIKCMFIRYFLFKPLYRFHYFIEGMDRKVDWDKPKKYKWLDKLTAKLAWLGLR